MQVIPAIDLMDGKVVRLKQGVMEDATTYMHDPCDVAEMFADVGAKRIHIVDLNGARTGESLNFKEIEKIASKVNVEIEIGGGIRSIGRAGEYINIGAKYIILGSAAVKDPEFAISAIKAYPGRVILGIDARGMDVVTEGWYQSSGKSVKDILFRYDGLDVESVIYTDVSKDGMLEGVNLEAINKVASISPFPVIASGGVSSISDIKDLIALANKNIKGCIVGKAIYEGKLNLEEAFPAE